MNSFNKDLIYTVLNNIPIIQVNEGDIYIYEGRIFQKLDFISILDMKFNEEWSKSVEIILKKRFAFEIFGLEKDCEIVRKIMNHGINLAKESCYDVLSNEKKISLLKKISFSEKLMCLYDEEEFLFEPYDFPEEMYGIMSKYNTNFVDYPRWKSWERFSAILERRDIHFCVEEMIGLENENKYFNILIGEKKKSKITHFETMVGDENVEDYDEMMTNVKNDVDMSVYVYDKILSIL